MSRPLIVPPSPPHCADNLTHQLLDERGEAIAAWWGRCIDLSDLMMRRHIEAHPDVRGYFLYMDVEIDGRVGGGECEQLGGIGAGVWSRHVAPVIDDLVHCGWSPIPPAPVGDYIKAAFPGQPLHLCATPSCEVETVRAYADMRRSGR